MSSQEGQRSLKTETKAHKDIGGYWQDAVGPEISNMENSRIKCFFKKIPFVKSMSLLLLH